MAGGEPQGEEIRRSESVAKCPQNDTASCAAVLPSGAGPVVVAGVHNRNSRRPAVAGPWRCEVVRRHGHELATGGLVALPLLGEPAEPVQGLYLLGALLLSIWLLDKATWSAEQVVRTHATNRVESHVHALVMRKCSTLDAAFYESPAYLDMLERAVRGALMNTLSFMWGFYFLMSAAASLVATMAVLSTMHWAVPVAIVVSALPQLIATSHFSRQGWALENSLATHYRLLKYLTALMSERQAANEVRLFGLSDYFVPRFRDINDRRLRREQAFVRRSTLWRGGLGVVSDVAVAGVWVFIALRALARAISAGDVLLGTQAAWRGKEALEATFSYGGQFFEQSLALVNLFVFLDLDPASVPGALRRSVRTAGRSLPSAIDRIEFRNVSFAYPAAQSNVLDDVSFTVSRGQTVALRPSPSCLRGSTIRPGGRSSSTAPTSGTSTWLSCSSDSRWYSRTVSGMR